MYFPDNLTFQYFFFDTYIGYFSQALPLALLVSAVYGFIRYRKDNATPIYRKIFSCAFICYMTGLVCLVVGLDIMGIVVSASVFFGIKYLANKNLTIGIRKTYIFVCRKAK